jgi:putative ABC transport system permease protein
MAFAVAILIIGRYFVDAIEHIAEVQFRIVQRDDLTVSFQNPLALRVRHDLARLPGVIRTESFRAVPVRLRHEHRTRRVGLIGLEPGGELHRLVDRSLSTLPVPIEGVLLTAKLAEILAVESGDLLTVEVLEGPRPRRRVPVAGVVDELVGLSAYMERGALNRLMREAGTVSGAFLTIDDANSAALYRELKRTPAVGGVALREAMLRSFEDTLAQSMSIFTTVLILFASVIAVAIIYNAARIALSERGRELASLRVLGFTRREVSLMLLGEQALLTALSIPIGFALGYQLCAALASRYQWELFRLPLVVSGRTYAFAVLVTACAAIGSAILVRRRLDRLDLVEVLKTRE